MCLLTRWHNSTSDNYKTDTGTQIQHKNNTNTQKTKEERKTNNNNNNNNRGEVISAHAIKVCNLDTRWKWVDSITPQALNPREIILVPVE